MGRHANTKRVFIPFVRGPEQRAHPYAVEPPGLEKCENGSFAQPGSVGKRRAYTALSTSILGGGTISNIRRIAAHGDELLAFTSTELYSWSASDSKWALKGSHLAIKTTERSRFIRTTEQIDCDRAELGNVIVYAWTDSGDQVYLAAIDKTTGSVLLAPTAQGANTEKARLWAGTTNILLFVGDNSSNLKVKTIGPTTLATDAAAAFTTLDADAHSDNHYDVAEFSSTQAVVAIRNSSSEYNVRIVGDDGVEDDSVTSPGTRKCNGPIAVAVESNGSKVAVFRTVTTGSAIQGDILDSLLDDTAHLSKAVGTFSTTCNQIAAAFRSVQNSSQYRCYVFWSTNETTAASTAFESKFNYLDDGGNLGTQATFVYRLGIVSRAFDHGGTVYVWGAFGAAGSASYGGQIQNTYLLYNDAGTLSAKAAGQVGGGHAPSQGHLSQVESLGSNQFAWCAIERRLIPLDRSQSEYAARSPRDVTFEFDHDDARRTAQLGQTIYVSGGHILQYDGVGLVECGFHVFPWYVSVVDAGAGTVGDGSYEWSATLAWENAHGELDRSTTATFFDQSMSGGGSDASVSAAPSHYTLKQGTRTKPALEIWRTLVTPIFGAPRYLVTSKNPTATGDNAYVEADPATGNLATFTDAFADSTLDDKETNPENGGILENLAPPPASIITAGSDRLFLAGIAHDPLQVHYSKLRAEGEVASFHDALRVTLPAHGGDITGLAILNETLVAFKERAVYALDGVGFDNTGAGENFRPRLIADDVGAKSHDAIAVTPVGLLFFSDKGWHLLPSVGQIPKYIGAPFSDYDTDDFVDVHVLPQEHMILAVSTSRILMLDTATDGAWSNWTETSLVGGCVWNGIHHITNGSQVLAQDANLTSTGFSTDIKTAPFRIDGAMGYGRVKEIQVLGRYKGTHVHGMKVYRDYQATAFDTKDWVVSPTTANDPLQFEHGPSIQKMEAVQVEVNDQGYDDDPSEPTGDTVEWLGIELLVGAKGGRFRLPVAQKSGGSD